MQIHISEDKRDTELGDNRVYLICVNVSCKGKLLTLNMNAGNGNVLWTKY